MKGKFQNSILSKLMLSTVFILLVPYFVANYLLYHINYSERLRDAEKVNESLLEQGSRSMQEYYQDLLAIPLVIYEDNAFRRLLMQQQEYDDRELYAIRLAITGMLNREATLVSVSVRTPNGERITQEKMDVETQRRANLAHIKQTYQDIPKETDVAEVELTFSTKQLAAIAEQMKEEQDHSAIFLIDKSTGGLVFSTEAIREYERGEREAPDTGTFNGERGFFFSEEFTNGAGSYELIKFIPRRELLDPIYQILWRLSLVQALLLVFEMIFVYSVYRHMIRPIRRIAENIDKVREGEYSYRAAGDSGDEIGVLDQKYEEMVITINDLINKDLKNALEISKTRLKALQAQINPHFLNNVLQSISTLALKEGAKETSRQLGKLARIFRYTMDTSTDTASVEREAAHLADYLSLQQSRFREKLEYRIEVDPNAEPLLIPKMVLQPLAENAVTHGRGGVDILKIEVRISCPDELRITVRDNGGTFSEERQAEIRQEYENYQITPDDGHGIGLLNVLYRLKLYAKEFRWEISCIPGQETRIELSLDVEGKGHEGTDCGR